MNINDFKNDYLNLMTINDISIKYNISNATIYNLIKNLRLKRDRTSKIKRKFNIDLYKEEPIKEPIKEEPIKEPIKEEPIIKLYDKRTTKQKLPKNLSDNLNIVKIKPKKNDDYDNSIKEAMIILNNSNRTLKDKNIN